MFVFFLEKKKYFSLKNAKYKYYISCQFVETTHLRLICIRRMKSCSSSTRKKPKKKRLTSFLHKFSKFQHLQGLMTFLITRNGKAVLEISRSDVDRYNSSFAVKMTNFETFILFILFILLFCHTQ